MKQKTNVALTMQVNKLAQTIVTLAKELHMIRENIEILAKVAHHHNDIPESVKKAIEDAQAQ